MNFRTQIIILFLTCNFFVAANANSSDDIAEEGKYATPGYDKLFEEANSNYENADEKLNAIYKELSAYYQQKDYKYDLKLLREAENYWIKFRDSWCDLESNHGWDHITLELNYIECRTLMTEEQTHKLSDLLEELKN